MSIEKIKAEFEGVEIEWRLHERIRQLFAVAEAAQRLSDCFAEFADRKGPAGECLCNSCGDYVNALYDKLAALEDVK